jgi:hypothetical protein
LEFGVYDLALTLGWALLCVGYCTVPVFVYWQIQHLSSSLLGFINAIVNDKKGKNRILYRVSVTVDSIIEYILG